MCNFNELTQEQKQNLHTLISQAAKNVGGLNFLLLLIEAIREKKHNALIKGTKIATDHTTIQWNKVIFKDKADLLQALILELREANQDRLDLADMQAGKKKKHIINMLKALAPVEFTVTPKNLEEGEPFTFKIFETSTDESVVFSPLFISFFICSTELSKKAMKYEVML